MFAQSEFPVTGIRKILIWGDLYWHDFETKFHGNASVGKETNTCRTHTGILIPSGIFLKKTRRVLTYLLQNKEN
jgi:hypothetical protein